jgi:hypothetical protein
MLAAKQMDGWQVTENQRFYMYRGVLLHIVCVTVDGVRVGQ